MVQRGVKPAVIVEGDPVDHLVHRGPARRKALAMQARNLQRAPQAFGRGIVPAVALAAHRGAHPQPASSVWNSPLQYWLPRSECKINPGCGRRWNHAIVSASMTNAFFMSARIAYLTESGRARYREFLAQPSPRAFVICPDGRFSTIRGGSAYVERERKKRANGCEPYLVNDAVVWKDQRGH